MNRTVRPVSFAFEPDVVSVFAKIGFGAVGAPTLDTNNSKGICNVTRKAISVIATTDGTTAVLTAVSSFAGLYVGMIVTGVGIPVGAKIASMNPGAGTITLDQNTTSAHIAETISISGGQYVIQFGRNAGVNLDTYNKLLHIKHVFLETGLQGGVSTAASAPAAPAMFVTSNLISVRTIPTTIATNLTDATVTVQFGTGAGTSFVAIDPAAGEIVELAIELCRSGAI